jgi:elongator complex protein 4
MSFRKRNSVVSATGDISSIANNIEKPILIGTRPSPLDGRLTTSTGTRSLDAVLAGHAGLTLGTSLLIEERGTTDFGGILLRYYAAEGIVQGHQVHVLGMSEIWARELPGLASVVWGPGANKRDPEDKMKIAWRYERLGEAGRGGRSFDCIYIFRTLEMYCYN